VSHVTFIYCRAGSRATNSVTWRPRMYV